MSKFPLHTKKNEGCGVSIWYEVRRWLGDDELKPREVIRETEKQVVYIEDWGGGSAVRRAAKVSDSSVWFESWDEAKAYAVERARKKLERAREDLDSAEEAMIRAMSLEKETARSEEGAV